MAADRYLLALTESTAGTQLAITPITAVTELSSRSTGPRSITGREDGLVR